MSAPACTRLPWPTPVVRQGSVHLGHSIMLHHLSFGVSDLQAAARFYDAVLAPLGLVRVWSDFDGAPDTQAVGYGQPGGGDRLALKQHTQSVRPLCPGPGFHLALAAPSEEAVQRFHTAALQHGGQDNGLPGLRPHYGAGYYAAFVIDPDGYRLEAVCKAGHDPSAAA